MLLSKELKIWQRDRNSKTAAGLLEIPLPTFRKYLQGKRHPNKLAEVELRRRMEVNK